MADLIKYSWIIFISFIKFQKILKYFQKTVKQLNRYLLAKKNNLKMIR